MSSRSGRMNGWGDISRTTESPSPYQSCCPEHRESEVWGFVVQCNYRLQPCIILLDLPQYPHPSPTPPVPPLGWTYLEASWPWSLGMVCKDLWFRAVLVGVAGEWVIGGNSRHPGYNFYVTQERESLPPRILILPLDAPEPLWLGDLFHLLVRKRPCSNGWRASQGQPFQDKELATAMPSHWSPDLSQAPPGGFLSTFSVLLPYWAEG